MSVVEKVQAVVEPLASARGVEIYDIEHSSGVLRIMLDREGGIDVDTIGEMASEISEALDLDDPIPDSKYLLEVTSPGIERKLRTPAHFIAQINEDINLKTVADFEGPRRLDAKLTEADEDGITVVSNEGKDPEPLRLAYNQIESARTIFHWGEQTTSPRGRKTADPSTDKKASAQ